ncbi:hypothetical protein NOC27_2177 [Nitrosococcus oceani AFC27]|nr:hypothetical protein NOC27_2177 [Nitrosococcus oceani AFC27]
MIKYGSYFAYLSFNINSLIISHTMISLRIMVWYFYEAVVLGRTIPSNIPLKKSAWWC